MKLAFKRRLRRGGGIFRTQNLSLKLVYLGIGAIVGLFFLAFLLFAYFSADLPSPNKLKDSSGNATTFYDREDKIIYQMYKDKNRIPVDIKNVAKDLKNATVAIEDKDFYHHSGYSTKGLIRGLLNKVVRGRAEGGSTLTQQLVKNVLLTSERTLSRKIKELVLSIEI